MRQIASVKVHFFLVGFDFGFGFGLGFGFGFVFGGCS